MSFYFLTNNEFNFIVLASKQGCPSIPFGTSGPCESQPQRIPHRTNKNIFTYTCAIRKADDPCWENDGNYIRAMLMDDDKTLKLLNIYAEYCNPKPPACHCNTMLSSLLSSLLPEHPNVDKIVGYFAANPFIKGCKCYLGSAAKSDFKFLQMMKVRPGAPEECSRKISFDETNYGKVCEDLQKEAKKCWKDEDGGYGDGAITKV